ncbi:MAG: HEPN domain-containing protein [Nitrospirae bacterium]|nr:HEPN domain-containing protein [Nitrospirota bacterium]MCL5977218.1 HEPN domain-containing protein [Nitrospirota bacterium]
MSNKEELKELIRYWFEKSHESLDAARDELKAGRLSFSVNRIYYSCFYAVSAILLQEKLRFKKHSGVRAAFHQHLVKSGKVSREHGKLYDELFEARQRGDYIELVSFEKEQVEDWLEQACRFIEVIKLLIKK